MKLKEFSFRNICSYGEMLQTIKLSDKPELIVISGDNGAGKTTIANALTFAIYGKSTQRKLSRLANRYNKNGYTEVKFMTSTGNEAEIYRGLQPNSFDLIVDSIPKNVSGKGNIDKMIDNQLVGIPFEIFSNNILLSINDFKSMVNMKPEDKRKIVDRIFDMYIVNDMHKILKQDVSDANGELFTLEYTITTQEDILAQNEARMALLKEEHKKADEKKKVEIEDKILSLKEENVTLAAMKEEFVKKFMDIENKVQDFIDKQTIEYKPEDEKKKVEEEFSKKSIELKRGDAIKKDTELQKVNEELTSKMTALANKIKEYEDDIDANEKNELDHNDAAREEKMLDINSRRDRTINEYDDKLKAIDADLDKANKQIHALFELKTKLKSSMDRLDEKIIAYNNDICPTCDTELTDAKHKKNLQLYTQERAELTKKMEDAVKSEALAESTRVSLNEKKTNMVMYKSDAIVKMDEESKALDAEWAMLSSTISSKYKQKRKELSDKQLEANGKLNAWKTAKDKEIQDRYEKIFKGIDAELNVKKSIRHADIDKKYATLQEERSKKIDDFKKQHEADKLSYNEKKINAENSIDKNNEKIEDLNLELAALGEDKSSAIKSLQETIDGINNKIDEIKNKKNKVEERLSTYNIVGSLFGDNGIKQVMFDTVVPIFNASISQLVKDFEYKFDFGFDNKFEPYILENGFDVEWEDLSTGEKKEMDLIVVLAVLELIKRKHPNMNLLFLDEIFNSLSPRNIEKVVGILRNYMQKYGMTIFVISHTPVPLDLFDKVIEVQKDNYFSNLEVK